MPRLPEGLELTAHDAAFREAPDAVYDRLRIEAPLHDDAPYGRRFLTRHADVRHVLRDKAFGVDARKSLPQSYMRRVAATGVQEAQGDAAYEPPLVLLDDPAHRRIRQLVSKAFTPKAIAAQRPVIEALTAELLDGIERTGDTEVDFIARFAGPLPTRVISSMMGLDALDCADLKRWSDAILMGYDPERSAATQRALREGYLAMSRVFRDAVAARRHAPGDDLISELVRAQEDHDRLTDLEIISLCVQLLVAGNVTTTDLMGNGLNALLQQPAELAGLRADWSLMPQAVEEMLRIDCPLTETARIALAPTAVAGCPVSQGETLTVSLAAANHDPGVFDAPHAFRIKRDNAEHLAFATGPHVCLGAALARLEGEVCLRAFLQRFPDVRLAATPARRRHLPSFRGFESLPVLLR